MNKFQKQDKKSRILKLASLRSTGTPTDLAYKLEISTRSVKRYIKELRDEGTEIWFCHTSRSYITGKQNFS